MNQVQTGAITAAQIVGGKVATRLIRNYIPGGKPLPNTEITTTQLLIEMGAAVGVGYLASMFLSARVGANLMAGGFVGVVESAIKKYRVGGDMVKDLLGDDGDPSVITVPSNMAGYVRDAVADANGRLAGYPQEDLLPVVGEDLGL